MSNPITVNISAQPTYTADAGYDLHANENLTLYQGARALISTGVHAAIPPGHVGLICPRSGLAHKHGVTVLNAPGIVDAGYTGEIKVNLHNTSRLTRYIKRGDRIAQLVIVPIADTHLVQVDSLEATERGSNGHGSTGN